MTEAETMAMPPGVLAEALAEVRAYARVDGGGEDGTIAGLIGAAAAMCEAFGGVTLIARGFDEYLGGTVSGATGWTRLARTPVRQVADVRRVGGIGDLIGVTLPVDAFAVDVDADGDGWVRLRSRDEAAVRVRYRAGLSEDWGGLPAPLRQGVVRLASHLYVHRDGVGDAAPPAAVTALWRPYRRMPFGKPRDWRTR